MFLEFVDENKHLVNKNTNYQQNLQYALYIEGQKIVLALFNQEKLKN